MTDGLSRAIEVCGGVTALAQKLGISQSAVSNWKTQRRRVPAEQVLKIERATGRKVTRHELRPDLYPEEPRKPRKSNKENKH